VHTLIREVCFPEFEFLYLETTLDKFFSLIASDSDMNGDFLISLDAESSHSVASTGLDGFLISKILEHFGGLSELIT